MFFYVLEAIFPFSTHDDAADFSKTVRRVAGNMGHKVAISIDESHVVKVRIRRDKHIRKVKLRHLKHLKHNLADRTPPAGVARVGPGARQRSHVT